MHPAMTALNAGKIKLWHITLSFALTSQSISVMCIVEVVTIKLCATSELRVDGGYGIFIKWIEVQMIVHLNEQLISGAVET